MKSGLLLLNLAAVLLFGGCTASRQHFIIGLYDVPPRDFQHVASAGFNTVTATAEAETLTAADAAGLKVIASGGPAAYQRFGHYPALYAWYLYDEPDMHLVSPQEIKTLNRDLHRVTSKPSFLVLQSGAAVEKYRGAGDLMAVDWYPVPWAPVATLAREMRLARLGMQGGSFLAVLQAFDWSAFPELVRYDGPLRPPTQAEMRCMSYLALMQGASGILYYSYETPQWKLTDHPDVWRDLVAVVHEVRTHSALFEHRVPWWPVRIETHGPAADMFNEIMEARVLLGLFEVKKRTGSVEAGYYLVAANTSALPADVSINLPFSRIDRLETQLVGEPYVQDGLTIRKAYAPFEVSIVGPIAGKLSD